ncbi:MAG TPA: HEAT repeat domain-containing protein [Candidatus Acidoferrum sp.]|nr:HEAT repeat domain-containing protein [Candidatus Acidoferrum sp.]
MMKGILLPAIFLPALLLLAVQASGQVNVDVLSPRQQYLEGEPITVIVRVTNVGADPVGYDSCDGRVDLVVVAQQKITSPNLWGCFGGGVLGGSGCGIDHPPMLPPGKTTDFLYLLRDYRLKPGEYVLRASGKAGVRWHSTPSFLRADSAPMPPPKFHDGEPVPGELFEEKLTLNIRQADPEELKTAFIPYVRDAASSDPQVSYPARDAISQAAPPFLEKTIFEFASNPDTVPFAVKGLSRINTNESRSDLVNLFNSSTDPRIRESIVEALAEMSSSDQMDFFTGLLLASGSEPNDKILQWAILAIGRHGGDRGVDFLGSLQTSKSTQPSPWLRSVIATALSTSKSPRGIPILIEMYADPDSLVRNNACGSLMSLTHRTWCDGSGQTARLQSTWRDWWQKHAVSTRIYGPDECIAPNQASPMI